MTRPQAKRVRKAQAKGAMEWCVVIPTDGARYAENVLWHMRGSRLLAPDMMAKATIRKLPAVKRAGARV